MDVPRAVCIHTITLCIHTSCTPPGDDDGSSIATVDVLAALAAAGTVWASVAGASAAGDTDVDAAAEEARKRARSVKAKDVGLPMEQLRRLEPAVAPGSAQRRCFECARRAPGSAQTLMYVTVRVHSTSIYKYNLNTSPVIISYHLLSISEAISRV